MVLGGCARLLGSYVPKIILRGNLFIQFLQLSGSMFLKFPHADGSVVELVNVVSNSGMEP